jgi:hypothetical protein
VDKNGGTGRLTGHDFTWGDGEKHTGAQSHEECGRDEKIVASEYQTHGPRYEGVYEEEDETVKQNRHAVGADVLSRELDTVSLQKHARAESQEQRRGDRNLLRCKVGEHLIYTHIIFNIVSEVAKTRTSHHLFMKTILIYDSPDIFPDVHETFFIPPIIKRITLFVCVMFHETKFDEITKESIVLNVCVVH